MNDYGYDETRELCFTNNIIYPGASTILYFPPLAFLYRVRQVLIPPPKSQLIFKPKIGAHKLFMWRAL